MKVIDYERTKCYFKVEYEDGYIYNGTINIDENSINNDLIIAKLVINHEIGEIIEIPTKNDIERCKIIEKECELVYEEIGEAYYNSYLEREGFIQVNNAKKLNSEDIYYIYYYRPSEWKINGRPSNLIIKVLKEHNALDQMACIEESVMLTNIFKKHFLNRYNLINNDYILCCVPSHRKSETNRGPLAIFLKNICKNNKIIDGTDYLIRHTEIPEQKKVGKRSQNTHLSSVKVVDGSKVEGKKIILVDDITTSGSSLNGCRKILLNSGAKEVICFAFGKDI